MAVVAVLLCFGGYRLIKWFNPSENTPGEVEAGKVESKEDADTPTMEEALAIIAEDPDAQNEVNLYEIYKQEMAAKAQAEADSLAKLQAASVAE